MVRVFTVLSASMLVSQVLAGAAVFKNLCPRTIELYKSFDKVKDIPQGGEHRVELPNPSRSFQFHEGADVAATLAEFTVDDRFWYDISVIPPGPGNCASHADCAQKTGKSGYNVPMMIRPSVGSCKTLQCNRKDCPDAYLFPADNTKTHSCDNSATMEVIFCYDSSNPGPAPSANVNPNPARTPKPALRPSATTPCPGPASAQPINQFGRGRTYESGSAAPHRERANTPSNNQPNNNSTSGNGGASFANAKVKSSFTYRGAQAGNAPGSYEMVTALQQCSKQQVSLTSPVGPMSEEVSLVFRGPMEIYNIAVFDGSSGGDWKKVSSYAQNGATDNMVFLNNKNVDYNGGKRSPQGYASADGKSSVQSATQFSGILSEATDPSKIGAGPGVQTGAEVHIMTDKKCDGSCKGFYDENGLHGWNGGKKMFVTKVKMPQGSSPNQPAIWMLNAQVVRSNQYGCNCRGMGAKGGCGELDIAEVIETNPARDRVTTHYYFYNDGNAGRDNFAPRPVDAPTTYLTIIDDDGEGTIKILEIGGDDFDFNSNAVAVSQIKSWLDAKDGVY